MKQRHKSLKTVVLKQLSKLKSPQFLMLVFGLLAFALIEPAARGKFLDIVGASYSLI